VFHAAPGLAGLAVPLDKPSPKRDAAGEVVKALLADFPGKAGRKPEFVVAKSGRGVLWGDLFKTGGCQALVELTPQNDDDAAIYGVAFAESAGSGWVVHAIWDIPVTWRPAKWQSSGDDHLPAKPQTEPFLLRDLSGDGVPEVIVGGEVEKYYQEHYVLRFSARSHALELVASAMSEPDVVEDYVRLYRNSGRRSIWEEWQFLKWVGDDLVSTASWHDEVAYGAEDLTFSEGERVTDSGKTEVILIIFGKGVEHDLGAYQLTRDGRTFGRMEVKWKDEYNLPPDADEIQSAWLFEKTTGLPRRFYPGREDPKPVRRLEDFATVTIEGDAEAAKFFQMSQ
jgi:hypothetical protein